MFKTMCVCAHVLKQCATKMIRENCISEHIFYEISVRKSHLYNLSWWAITITMQQVTTLNKPVNSNAK